MASIPQEQFRKIFTQALVDVYRERAVPTGFLRSFFPQEVNLTKYVSIEVQRSNEKVAVDVVPSASDGTLNQATKSTQKILYPPMYWEYIDATDHYLYDVAIGQQTPTAFQQLVRELAEEQVKIREKIERAYELQAAQTLLDGIVQLKSGDNIDFRRKSGSMVDISSSAPWSTPSNDPRDVLQDAGKFLRQQGKVQGTVLNCICGDNAIKYFLESDFLKNYGDLTQVNLLNVAEPQRNAQGGTLHGEVSAGPYRVRMWSYPEYYTDENGALQPYLNEDKIIVIPEQPRFRMAFGAVPQLLGPRGAVPQSGAFYTFDYMNERAAAHEVHTKSRGVSIPTAVDQIFTAKVS